MTRGEQCTVLKAGFLPDVVVALQHDDLVSGFSEVEGRGNADQAAPHHDYGHFFSTRHRPEKVKTGLFFAAAKPGALVKLYRSGAIKTLQEARRAAFPS